MQQNYDLPSRFAIIPRYGSTDEIKWFEASPTYCLHWNNAYENGDEIILEDIFKKTLSQVIMKERLRD